MDYKIRFRVIMELMGGEKPIREITRQDCRLFQQQVLALPPNAFKRFPKMNLHKVIEHSKRYKLPLMAPKTVNLHISCLNLLMEWACRERLLDVNPARGLWVEETKQLKDKRDPFNPAQLKAIFDNASMRDYHARGSARFWVPMLSLWTGARLNELCQLNVADVGVQDGIYFIKVTEGDGKHVKTASANRIIPLHPELIGLGFADFFEVRREHSQARLFAELKNGSRGKPSEPFSKWFARYLQAVKAKTQSTCFHSFRHNFRDALREAGIEREVVQALGGWKDKSGGVEDNYGSGHSVQRLYDAICKIGYPRVA
jgi:integrase